MAFRTWSMNAILIFGSDSLRRTLAAFFAFVLWSSIDFLLTFFFFLVFHIVGLILNELACFLLYFLEQVFPLELDFGWILNFFLHTSGSAQSHSIFTALLGLQNSHFSTLQHFFQRQIHFLLLVLHSDFLERSTIFGFFLSIHLHLLVHEILLGNSTGASVFIINSLNEEPIKLGIFVSELGCQVVLIQPTNLLHHISKFLCVVATSLNLCFDLISYIGRMQVVLLHILQGRMGIVAWTASECFFQCFLFGRKSEVLVGLTLLKFLLDFSLKFFDIFFDLLLFAVLLTQLRLLPKINR